MEAITFAFCTVICILYNLIMIGFSKPCLMPGSIWKQVHVYICLQIDPGVKHVFEKHKHNKTIFMQVVRKLWKTVMFFAAFLDRRSSQRKALYLITYLKTNSSISGTELRLMILLCVTTPNEYKPHLQNNPYTYWIITKF